MVSLSLTLVFNIYLSAEKIELEENHIVQPLGSSFSTTMKLNIDIPLS